jgi:hypothetical protein
MTGSPATRRGEPAPLDRRTKAEQKGRVSDLLPPPIRPEITAAVTRGAARLMANLGWAPVFEFPLANGRRADLLCLSPRGEFAIIEVKSCLEDYRCDQKWTEYAPYADLFYFAVPPEFPRDIIPAGPGLIVADGFGGAVLKEAPCCPLAGARRKALTLQLARLAAFRSSGVVY